MSTFVNVLNFIPPASTLSPIFSRNHKTLQIVSYKEGDTLYPGGSITLHVTRPKMELKEVKVKIIQKILFKKHEGISKDFVSHPLKLQVQIISGKDIKQVAE